MPDERPIIRLRTAGTTRVAYGRARLTVKRWGDISSGKVGAALAAYERGDGDAEALAWAFVHDRISATSPSFDWSEADLERLVELVAGASTEPRLAAREPEALAPELIAAAERERQVMKEASKRIRQLGADILRMPRGLMADLAKAQQVRDSFIGKIGDVGGILRERQRLQGVLDQITGRGAVADLARATQFQVPSWFREFPKPDALFGGDIGRIARSWAEARDRSLPANWRELEREELDAVVEMMVNEGLSLAWAPRIEVIRELLAAPDYRARCKILESRADEIIVDISGALDGVYRDDLEPIVEAAREAIQAYRDGHPKPAQAYAASAIGEILHGSLGWESWGEVKREFGDKDPQTDVGFAFFPLYAVGRAWVYTLARFKDAGDGFNRNLTLHRIGFPYSEANLISVLLLLVGLLRGLQPALDRHDRREEDEAA
jgi:hypothetical protein